MKKVLMWLLIFTLTSCLIWADPGPDQPHIEAVKKKVAECVDHHRRVVVETYDNRRLQGFITEAGPSDFVLSYAGRVTHLSYVDVRKIRWPSPVWNQVKVGLAVAAVVGVIVCGVVLLGGMKG